MEAIFSNIPENRNKVKNILLLTPCDLDISIFLDLTENIVNFITNTVVEYAVFSDDKSSCIFVKLGSSIAISKISSIFKMKGINVKIRGFLKNKISSTFPVETCTKTYPIDLKRYIYPPWRRGRIHKGLNNTIPDENVKLII